MGKTTATEIHEVFADRFESDLRSVGYYDDGESEFVFIRDDVESTYDSTDRGNILRDIRLEAIDSENQESMYAHGDLLCTVRCFNDATELHTVVSETTGFVVAVDAGAITDLRETIEICQDISTGE